LFDAIAEVTGTDAKVSGSHVGRIKSLLVKAEPPYTPEEVRDFGRRFYQLCPWAARDNRRPTLGEIEKFIGKLRSTGPMPEPAANGRLPFMTPGERVAEDVARHFESVYGDRE
jgi:hypothetical protein